ncbi:5488_t:CDS:1, partial [Gigaspora margarita]
ASIQHFLKEVPILELNSLLDNMAKNNHMIITKHYAEYSYS